MRLGRDDVVRGALALLDEIGFDALTMRSLAKSLGVQAGAIYWHFADKQALVDAMTESMLAGVVAAPLGGGWRAQLRELAQRLALALLEHRDGARVAMQALTPGPHGLSVSEKMLAILAGAGFKKPHIMWATAVLGYYVLGYVVDVQATASAKARGAMAVVRALQKTLDRARYPHIAAASGKSLASLMSDREAEARFAFGLEVILDGLEGARRRKRVPSSGERRAKRPR